MVLIEKMFLKSLAVLAVMFLLYLAYVRFPPPPARITQPVMKPYDNQYEVFREMEPAVQTRENPWMGFLQEDINKNRTGPIGDFTGNDSKSGRAPLYMMT